MTITYRISRGEFEHLKSDISSVAGKAAVFGWSYRNQEMKIWVATKKGNIPEAERKYVHEEIPSLLNLMKALYPSNTTVPRFRVSDTGVEKQYKKYPCPKMCVFEIAD